MQPNRSFYEKKYIDCKALDIDTESKQVKIAIAQTGSLDRDQDIIVGTAANKSIKERGPQGTNEIWHLLDHTQNSFSALSKFSEMGMQGDYIYGVSKYKDSFAWREVAWPLYNSGDFTQHSIGFTIISSQDMKGYREIREIALWEGSAVLWGANPNTPILSIQKSLGISDGDDIFSQLERLSKSIKMGNFEDETHKSLIQIEIKRIQQALISTLKTTTQPSENDTKPERKELIEQIALIKGLCATFN